MQEAAGQHSLEIENRFDDVYLPGFGNLIILKMNTAKGSSPPVVIFHLL